MVRRRKVPCCSVCLRPYNEDERVPLFLQCGHSFCKHCLSEMFFSISFDTTLACPRCRQVFPIGNSLQGLAKNFAMIALIDAGQNFEYTDVEEDEDDDGDDDDDDDGGAAAARSAVVFHACGRVIEVGAHPEVKLVRWIGEEESGGGVQMWVAIVAGSGGVGGGRCKHRLAVKEMSLREDMDVDWMQRELDSLRKASMWCRNVCTFHGVVKTERSLYLLMDRCFGSVQSEMHRNEGRLTLEQILRYGADVARGVAELHAAGVISMNIKPSNLLLDASGNALVSDYGLAPILKKPTTTRPEFDDSSKIITPYTEDYLTTHSPQYIAPEAWGPVKRLFWEWEDASGVSPESDAWSFGCTLVEMCTGSIPWDGLNREEIFQAVVKARKVPPQYERIVGVGIPKEVWKMIGECLQFKPSKRPTFHAMLATFLRHLQEIPRSPDNGFTNICGGNVVVEETLPTNIGVLHDSPSNLHKLSLEGDSEGVRNILAKAAGGSGGSSVRFLLEAKNAEGESALHLACIRGRVEVVEAILEYEEANVDIEDKFGQTPLVLAVEAGSPQCVHLLIKKGANVRYRVMRDGSCPTVAHLCSDHGQPDCMRELLVAGADPNALDEEGKSVLHGAVAKKNTDCAIVILENGGSKSMAVSDAKHLTPLHMCVATCNVAVMKRWLEVSSPEEISQAINIPTPVGTALCMAAAIGKDHEKATEGREIVKILLAAGADPTAQDPQHGRTALHTAAVSDNVELVRVIRDAGVDANIRGMNNTIPLHLALARGANACVSLLQESGSDCNIQDDEGDNAFHIAADAAKMTRESRDWLVVMLRSSEEAAVNVRNKSGKTVRPPLTVVLRWVLKPKW